MIVDYLPSMYLYSFLVQSKRPEAIGSYDTLIYPLDKYCWYLVISSILAVFITLIFIQICWMFSSGERPSSTWIFQGHKKFCFICQVDFFHKYIFSDFILALTPVLDETIPWTIYMRNSFIRSRKLLLIQWLVMANILSHVYKGSILSSLININYEEPIDTIEQMVESGLPFYVLGNSAAVWVTETDQREMVKTLNARRFDMPWEGVTEEKYLRM